MMVERRKIHICCAACGWTESIDVDPALASGDPVAAAALGGSAGALQSVAREAWPAWVTASVSGRLVHVCPGCAVGSSIKAIA